MKKNEQLWKVGIHYERFIKIFRRFQEWRIKRSGQCKDNQNIEHPWVACSDTLAMRQLLMATDYTLALIYGPEPPSTKTSISCLIDSKVFRQWLA